MLGGCLLGYFSRRGKAEQWKIYRDVQTESVIWHVLAVRNTVLTFFVACPTRCFDYEPVRMVRFNRCLLSPLAFTCIRRAGRIVILID